MLFPQERLEKRLASYPASGVGRRMKICRRSIKVTKVAGEGRPGSVDGRIEQFQSYEQFLRPILVARFVGRDEGTGGCVARVHAMGAAFDHPKSGPDGLLKGESVTTLMRYQFERCIVRIFNEKRKHREVERPAHIIKTELIALGVIEHLVPPRPRKADAILLQMTSHEECGLVQPEPFGEAFRPIVLQLPLYSRRRIESMPQHGVGLAVDARAKFVPPQHEVGALRDAPHVIVRQPQEPGIGVDPDRDVEVRQKQMRENLDPPSVELGIDEDPRHRSDLPRRRRF